MTVRTTLPRSIYADKLAEFPHIAWAGPAISQNRGRWSDFFANRIGPRFGGRVILEIGCFDAGFLTENAAEHPDTAFIGIDWKCKAIYDGAKRLAERAIDNVLLLRTRANDLTTLFADGELDEIWIFHPDPCDKAAELKNRLVNSGFLREAAGVLKDRTSLLALKTDHPDYYQSVIDLFDPAQGREDEIGDRTLRNCIEISIASRDYWNDARVLDLTAGRAFSRKTTLFERRFLKRHKPIHYVELRKR